MLHILIRMVPNIRPPTDERAWHRPLTTAPGRGAMKGPARQSAARARSRGRSHAMFEGLLQGVWALVLAGPVLVGSVAATVFVVRRRAVAPEGRPEGSDQVFWDIF